MFLRSQCLIPGLLTTGSGYFLKPHHFSKDELGLTASLHTATLALKLYDTALPILFDHLPNQ